MGVRVRQFARAVTAVALVIAAGLPAVTSVAAGARVARVAALGTASATVPLLTGGLYTISGNGSATESYTIPASPSGCSGPTNSQANLAIGQFSTSWIYPVRYPDAPALDASQVPHTVDSDGHDYPAALTWPSTVGSATGTHANTDYDASTATCVNYTSTCTYSLDSDRPTDPAIGQSPDSWVSKPAWRVPRAHASLDSWGDCSGNGQPTYSNIVTDAQTTIQRLGGLSVPATAPAQKSSLSTAIGPSGLDNWNQDCVQGGCTCQQISDCQGSLQFSGTAELSCALCVTDITFRQLADPASTDGTLAQVPDSGTFDGNRVEIQATVHNATTRPFTTNVNFYDRTRHRPLIEDAGTSLLQPITFPAGVDTTVTFEWDTTGEAWENGQPHSAREVEVLTPLGGAYRPITVLPKPVVLVHGYFSGPGTWEHMKSMLQAINPDWQGYAVGDNPAWSGRMDTNPLTGNTLDTNAFIMGKYVESLRRSTGAQQVDLMGHSMGGLVSRDYIDRLMPQVPQPPDHKPVAAHLVMLGTPNMGSPCAVLGSTLAGFVSPGVAAPTVQLRPDYLVNVFDRSVTHTHGVLFSVMAGYGYGLVCNPFAEGDIIVPVTSAWWTLADREKTVDMHTDLHNDPQIVNTFIKRRLAVDSLGRAPAAPGTAGAGASTRPSEVQAHTSTAGAKPSIRTSSSKDLKAPVQQLIMARGLTLKDSSSVTTGFTVPAGAGTLQVPIIADRGVTAVLRQPSGKIQATQKSGSKAAAEPFRGFQVAKPAKGRWKLTLTRTSGAASRSGFGAGVQATFTKVTTTATRTTSGKLVIKAALVRGTTRTTGATVVARVSGTTGKPFTIALHDDGKNGDQRAHDGYYTAVTAALPADASFLAVTRAQKLSTVRIGSRLVP